MGKGFLGLFFFYYYTVIQYNVFLLILATIIWMGFFFGISFFRISSLHMPAQYHTTSQLPLPPNSPAFFFYLIFFLFFKYYLRLHIFGANFISLHNSNINIMQFFISTLIISSPNTFCFSRHSFSPYKIFYNKNRKQPNGNIFGTLTKFLRNTKDLFFFSIIIIYLVTTAMLKENQQFQFCQSSQVDESLSEMIEEKSELQLEEGLQHLPELERYLSSQYSIFNGNEFSLNQVCDIKNKMDLQAFNNAVLAYFCESQENSDELTLYSKNKSQISSQFVVSLKSIPMYSIVYVSIKQIKNNRCNMMLRNAKGECLAFYWRQRKCKKLQKLLKILARIRKPMMVVILDQSTEAKASIPQIEKISNITEQYIYVFENAQNITLTIQTNDLRSENFVSKDDKCCIQRIQNQIRIFSPKMAAISEGQIANFLIETCKTLQQEQISALQIVRGNRNEQKRHLALDFIFVNVFRVWKCSPKQVIVIILNLLMKKQESYNKKQMEQKQKQRDKFVNKSADSHFPQTMQTSKPCKRCQHQNKKKCKKPKKSNLRCQGCSVICKQDIPLCALCFADFHQNIDFYYRCMNKNRLKKRLRRNKVLSDKMYAIKDNKLDEAVKSKQLSMNQSSEESEECESPVNQMSQMAKKAQRLNFLLGQTFGCVNQLQQQGMHDVLQVFLGSKLKFSLDKMKDIALNHPDLNTGLTKIGSKIAKQLEKQHEQDLNKIENHKNGFETGKDKNSHEDEEDKNGHSYGENKNGHDDKKEKNGGE